MKRQVLMVVAGLVVLAAASNAQAFDLFRGFRGHGCCGAEPTCCAAEPVCAAEPTCCAAEPVCAVEPTCCAPEPTCCEPAPCCGHRRHGLFHHLRHKMTGLFHRGHGCCDAAPACCEPTCGVVEPSCCGY